MGYWLIQVYNTHGKTLNLFITTINLKSLLQLGMTNLICLVDHTLFKTFRIILGTYQKT